ncbi:MAG: ATP-binding protein [Chloroflexota bacterium]|nr:ATP-binding protein [Chloroflexota bacterium]
MIMKTVELKIPSEIGYEKLAMRVAGELAEQMGFSKDRIDDLRTAVAEACINAIEHGNQLDKTTRVFILMTIHEDRLAINVADEGRGGPPPKDIIQPDMEAQIEGLMTPGGMGLFVIRALVDEAEFVKPNLGNGNEFQMVVHLQPKEKEKES